ncbi:hypothetical protein ACN077_09410 [Clostridium chromiireducens]|uniref:hypothetical protein n=1 Tax=Clostridium chromiireducens TaxID=225345 RepID=UPI003AF8A70D
MDINEEKNYLANILKDNEIINFITDMFQNGYEKYINFAEILDGIEEISGPAKLAFKIIDYGKRLKFKAFIMNIYMEYNSGNCDEKDIKKLRKYLDKPKNLNFIIDTIDSAINSKSIWCSSLLAIFAGKILKERNNIEYKDYVIINALKIMLDDYLQNFKKIYEFLQDREVKRFRINDIREELINNDFKIFELEQTIEKLKGIQVLGYDIGGVSNLGNAWGAFMFNENSHYLYSITNMHITRELN